MLEIIQSACIDVYILRFWTKIAFLMCMNLMKVTNYFFKPVNKIADVRNSQEIHKVISASGRL